MRYALLVALMLGGCSKSKPELLILTWSDYMAEDTVKNFEKEYNCVVKVDYIQSPEEMLAKLRGGAQYDVVFPSDDIAAQLAAEGLIQKLDSSKIGNLKNISQKWRGLDFDPRNEVSVPYMWGTTGIAYRKSAVQPAPDSWAALWDPKYVPKMSMLDDLREVFTPAMLLNGDDPRKPTAESIERAKKKLMERRPLRYNSAAKNDLIEKDVILAQYFNGDTAQASAEAEGDVGFVIPKEGATLWVDSMAIGKGKQGDLAHAFINYILRPEVSGAISNAVRYGNPNEAATPHIEKGILEDPMIYPPEADLNRCRVLPPLSAEMQRLMKAAYEELKK